MKSSLIEVKKRPTIINAPSTPLSMRDVKKNSTLTPLAGQTLSNIPQSWAPAPLPNVSSLQSTLPNVSSIPNVAPLQSTIPNVAPLQSTISSIPPIQTSPTVQGIRLSPKGTKVSVEETLMKMGNKVVRQEPRINELVSNKITDKALPINTSLTKVSLSGSTAQFSTYEGVGNQDIEKALLERDFIPIEKILTKDNSGNLVCRFIKVRDKLGHMAYVELDTTCSDGMGFLTVSPNEEVFIQSNEASVVPYSLKVGSFEASNNDLYGVGFECNNSICVMSRKDNSLDPVETVFTRSQEQGIQDKHPIPFPIVKLTEILSNPKVVQHNIKCSHNRMRNVAFNSCVRDVENMKNNSQALVTEVNKFSKLSSDVSGILSCTINDLETWHESYEKRGIKCEKDADNVRNIKFNLNKRHELTSDYIAMCHGMRERNEKIASLVQELKSMNEFAETLFNGLENVFTE